MTRALGALPPPLLRLLDGDDLQSKVGETFLLTTVAADGYPHVALLSVGEVYAASPSELRLGLWHASATTENLARDGRATLVAFVPPAAYYVELGARREADITVGGSPYARFVAHPRAVREDIVGYATLESGIRFTLPKQDKVLARWRAQIEALKAG